MKTFTNLDCLYSEIEEQIFEIDAKLELYGDDVLFERLRLYEAKLELQRIFIKLRNDYNDIVGAA